MPDDRRASKILGRYLIVGYGPNANKNKVNGICTLNTLGKYRWSATMCPRTASRYNLNPLCSVEPTVWTISESDSLGRTSSIKLWKIKIKR